MQVTVNWKLLKTGYRKILWTGKFAWWRTVEGFSWFSIKSNCVCDMPARSPCAGELSTWHLLGLVEHMVDKPSSSTAAKRVQNNQFLLQAFNGQRVESAKAAQKANKMRLWTHSSFSFWIFSGSVSCMFFLNCCLTMSTRSSVLYFCKEHGSRFKISESVSIDNIKLIISAKYDESLKRSATLIALVPKL